MQMKAVSFRKDGFYSQPFAFGGEEGPCDVFVSGDTLQLTDCSKTDWPWTMFDPEEKQQRHDTVFPKECEEVFDLGRRLAGGSDNCIQRKRTG